MERTSFRNNLLKTRPDLELGGRTAGLNVAVGPKGDGAVKLVPGTAVPISTWVSSAACSSPVAGRGGQWRHAGNDIPGIDVAVDEDLV